VTADISELPPRVLTTVRHHDAAALGLPARTTAIGELPDGHALCLGPDEWLVCGGQWSAAAGRAAEQHWRAVADAAADVSAQWTALAVTGPGAADLLAAGCSVDLHPRIFRAGRCAQTLVARVPAIVTRLNSSGYELLVRPSYAGYLAAFLRDAQAG
jgi:sarcosine oxidase, subunit gamma